MSSTATDPERLPPTRRRPIGSTGPGRLTGLLILLCLLGSCAEEPLPQRNLTVDDCLREVKMDRLKQAIERCDRVVAAFPKDPDPLNERFLLHSLAGDNTAACRDIAQAAALAGKLPHGQIDPLLRNDLILRQASCRD